MINNKIEAIHTLARQYCIGRIDDLQKDWTNKVIEICKRKKEIEYIGLNELYKELTFEEISELTQEFSKAYPEFDIHVRLPILRAMLNTIEVIKTDRLSSEYQINQAIHLAIHNTTIHYGISFAESSSINLTKIYNDEKQLFYDYINEIKESDLQGIDPLPFRIVLTFDEVVKVKEAFKNNWLERICSITDSCYEDIVKIDADYFFNEVNFINIENILKKHGINKIWEVDTCNIPAISHLMDITLLDIQSKTGDVFWCSEKMDWGIVRDHEGFIYICSKWFINEIESFYPNLLNK